MIPALFSTNKNKHIHIIVYMICIRVVCIAIFCILSSAHINTHTYVHKEIKLHVSMLSIEFEHNMWNFGLNDWLRIKLKLLEWYLWAVSCAYKNNSMFIYINLNNLLCKSVYFYSNPSLRRTLRSVEAIFFSMKSGSTDKQLPALRIIWAMYFLLAYNS